MAQSLTKRQIVRGQAGAFGGRSRRSKDVEASIVNAQVVAKYAVYFLAFLVLSRVNFFEVSPFSFAVFVALLFIKQNVFALVPLFILANLFAHFDFGLLLIATSQSVILGAFYLAHKYFRQNLSLALLLLYVFLAQGLYLFFVISDGSIIVLTRAAIYISLLLIFTLSTINIVSAVYVKRLKYKLTVDEQVALAGLVAAFGFCIASFYLPFLSGVLPASGYYYLPASIALVKFAGVTLVLVSYWVFGSQFTYGMAVAFGLGASLAFLDLHFVALLCVSALVLNAFKGDSKIYCVLSILAIDVAFIFIFGSTSYIWLAIVPTALAGLLFLGVPTSFRNYVANNYGGVSERVATRSVINRSREKMARKLSEMADVFFEMDQVFAGLKRGKMDKGAAVALMSAEVATRLCKDCASEQKCLRFLGDETNKLFSSVVDIGVEKGRVSVLDIPMTLTKRCVRINSLISIVNGLVEQYKQHIVMATNMDNSKILIGEQLGGVGKILKQLSVESRLSYQFDLVRERRIMEELSILSIVALEVVAYKDSNDITNVSVVVRESDAHRDSISFVVSAIMGERILVSSRERDGGLVVMHLRSAPRLDIVFGAAGVAKAGSALSGDVHSFLRVGQDRFMLSVCDGMGSGELARRASNTAITLVENFYKAGFENDLILSSVNRLLSINAEEVFTSVDICVVDLIASKADFIKIGSACGYIKRASGRASGVGASGG
ncbi:MAG: SpoIIE family protein phosphatase, partial [Firmicutes bacterium]|nr:SpoIIE family protein phosphatase [Bacillota bacterium]